ncbi:MAG: amino acid transporter [Bradymonadia bacterium]|jgi:amino acid transporter
MSGPAEKKRDLGLIELVAISLGGMIGGGIFSILGVAVEQVGNAAPVAIAAGAGLALLAAWSYARLAAYYEDEGATYSFFKRTFPGSRAAAAAIGWLVVFGYISTLALYAFTFASYLGSLFPEAPVQLLRGGLGGAVLATFAVLNIVSVKWMGRVEDVFVYTKLLALVVVTGVLYFSGSASSAQPVCDSQFDLSSIWVVAALTFVAFEGFQLSIHAYSEVNNPRRNVPRAIYISITIAALVYVLLAEGALWALDKQQIIADREFALAAGAAAVLGPMGHALMLGAALLATSSAISGTLFGAARLMAVIADDGYLPATFSRRVRGHVPARAIIVMAALAWILVLTGGLDLILEFGSLTFMLVSLLMAVANLKIREHTGANLWVGLLAVAALVSGVLLIISWQLRTDLSHFIVTLGVGVAVVVGSMIYARRHPQPLKPSSS